MNQIKEVTALALAHKNRISYALIALGVGMVLYLSWQPQPSMTTDWFIPRWLAAWADENGNDTIRTGVPLVALGLLTGVQLAWQRQPWRQWAWAWLGLSGMVVVAEIGQLFLVNRSFDVKDAGWGAAGALVGLGTAAGIKAFYARKLKPGNK